MSLNTELSPTEWQNAQIEQNGKIIDVRTEQEFAETYIAGAENINIQSPNFQTRITDLPKNESYFLYCRSGVRSSAALEYMKKLGFEKLYNLKGGIMAWEFESKEVEYGDLF